MTPMRRRDREITDFDDILAIVDKCKIMRIAMIDENGVPYIVPLNFGYIVSGDGNNKKINFYFHSAKNGRKIDILKNNGYVCFEMDCDHKLIEAEFPCAYSFMYKSIIGYGNVRRLEDLEERKAALNSIMKNQSGHEFQFEEKHLNAVALFEIETESLSGKARLKK